MIAWFEKHNRLSWFVVVVIAVFIFYISSLSFEGAPTFLVGGTYLINFLCRNYLLFVTFTSRP